MIWILVRKELLASLLTLRLAVVLVFAVTLSVLTAVMGSLDYSQALQAYHSESRDYRERQKDVTVYEQLDLVYYMKPQPLAILARGASEASGYFYELGIYYERPDPTPLRSDWNDRIRTLVRIDFTGAVALLFSFLAVVLGFDAICGERERGTLQQVLANPVSRGNLAVAKLLGGLAILWAALSLAFVVHLLILLANPDIHLAGEQWVRLALYFALSCLFLGQVYALSLMVSSYARNSPTALIVCLFGWLLGGVGYANALPSLSAYGVEERPIQDFWDGDGELWDRFSKDMEGWEERNPRPGPAYLRGFEGNGRLRYAHPEGYAWMQRRNEYRLNKTLERTEASTKLIWPATTGPHIRQGMNIEEWAFLSPFANYKNLAKQLARSSLDDRLRIGRLGIRFRKELYQHMQEQGLFGNRRWFTDDPEDQEPMISDPGAVTEEMLHPDSPFMRERMRWVEAQEEKARGEARRKLDLRTLPQFTDNWQRALPESLQVMVPGLVVLFLIFGLSVMVTVMRLLRYDPR